MKKILFTLILSGLLISQSVFCADYFKLGRDAFNKKDYTSANSYFVKALTENPNNANGRYYYAQTLTYLKNYKQARKEYGYVIQLAPNTTLAEYAKQSIAYLDNLNVPSETTKTLESDNYIKRAISNKGELVTWNPDNMPVKVYFDNSKRVSTGYVTAAKNALDVWKNAISGDFSYAVISEPQYADVKVVFAGMAPNTDNQTLGTTYHNELNGYIKKATITLYTLDKNYKPLRDFDVYNVALHEYGHMLGIDGHSDSDKDIMYATYDKTIHNAQMSLSSRDINTAKALYEIDKNPYGTTSNSINRVLGNKDARLSDKMQQSLDYIKSLPNNPTGYVDAGDVYMEMGNEVEAINYYKKALAILPNYEDANKRLAKLYYKRDDINNAEIYCRNLMKNYPKDSEAYVYLTDLYIRKNKISQARVVLNSLVYRNPAAKNDAYVKKLYSQINK